MRHYFFALPLALALTGAATAQWGDDRGPGVAPRNAGGALVYPIDGFTAVSLALPANVDVRVGPGFSVRATGPARAFNDIRVTRDGSSLQIERRYRGRSRDENLARGVHFVVTMPRIEAANIGGSGGIKVDRVNGRRFDAAVGGSGSLMLGTVAVDRLSGDIGGSGSGRFAGELLRARGATVSIAGSGGVRAQVEGNANVSIAGSGNADLGPRARCSVSRVGSGRARCGN